ncbi:MAG: type II secretion system protein N [Burkholderiaceae bacterium]|nr:MAG: type II secretion system protein N [Burkholderiaceae bacterium]
MTPGPGRGRTPWRWALAGTVLGTLLVLIVAAPASWLAAALGSASQHKLVIADPEGTVWSGSGRLIFSGGAGSRDRTELPGRIQWRLRPALTHLTADLRSACCTPAGPLALRVTPRWGGVQVKVSDSQSAWPVSVIAGLGTPWNTIQPEGQMTIRTQQLEVRWISGRFTLGGRAQVTVSGASSRLSTLRPIGSYKLVIEGGEPIAIHLSTLSGALQLSGQGTLVGQRLHFSGEAHATPGTEVQLAGLLNMMGRRQGNRALLSFN